MLLCQSNLRIRCVVLWNNVFVNIFNNAAFGLAPVRIEKSLSSCQIILHTALSSKTSVTEISDKAS